MAVAANPVPRAPERTQAGGGGSKGLIFGLVGVAVVLLGAIGIVLMKKNRPADTDLPPIAINTAPTATSVQAAPPELKPLDPAPVDTAPPVVDTAAPATGGAPAAGKPPVKDGGKPTTPPPPKGDGCDACKTAAASGNASGVQSALGRCTDEGKKAECKSILGRSAITAVHSAALNGQCDRAKALASAAEAAGVKGAARGLNGTSCK